MSKWNKEDIDYLIENYARRVNINEIINRLNRSRKAISHKAARLGLSRPRIPHNKPKNPEYRKIIDKRYYEKNKKKIYRRKRDRVMKYKREFVRLLGGKCENCDYNKCVAALDFHHINGKKERLVSVMFNNSSKEKILKEANKCILLCANCHRELHHKGP